MTQLQVETLERIGKVNIERCRTSIRLRWSFSGKRYSLTIGQASKDGLKVARAKAQIIDSDITYDRFDTSLEKYGQPKSTVLSVVPDKKPEISLRELWDKFLFDKLPNLKAKSAQEYSKFTRLLDKLDSLASFNSLETKQALLKITTVDQTRRMMQYLGACCDWGVKHKLIIDNPYKGMAAELPKRKSLTNPTPSAFSEEERDAVIEAFKRDKRPGTNYSHYAPLVEFWFLTGCRPSEAIGLSWECVADDFSSVTFKGSYQVVDGKHVWSEGSKNNKVRTIAISSRLSKLLELIKPDKAKPSDLVFPSPEGKIINYDNFTRRAWNAIVDPIKPGMTPYNCRDTFVTLQLLHGVPSAVIAKWCDTSTRMIDNNYADKLKLSQLRPID